MADDFAGTMRKQIAARPRVMFVCQRDWLTGHDVYVIGFLWSRNFDAMPGEWSYLRHFLIRVRFLLWVERS